MTWLVIITAGLGLNKYYPPKGELVVKRIIPLHKHAKLDVFPQVAFSNSANFHTFTRQFDQHVTASPDEFWYTVYTCVP